MKELTRAEEQVMHILWEKENAFVKEIIEQMPDPKPAYNTVSTIIRILVEKNVVGYEAFGKSHRYYPIISKTDYRERTAKSFVERFFDDSPKELVSFFLKEKKLSATDLDEILKTINQGEK